MLRTSAASIASFTSFDSTVAAVLISSALASACQVPSLAATGVDQPNRRETIRPDGDAERQLIADLKRVESAASDDFDLRQFDTGMACAFRAYGLDLDRVSPEEAASKLAGWRSTPEIVAAIDDWCMARRSEPENLLWRRLASVARAADADPWRNALRDHLDRAPADPVASLRARAAQIKAMKRQPARSLVLLVRLLWQAGDPATATPVLMLAEQRFPDDFWVCIELGNLNMVEAPATDPAEAARYFSRAIALRPKSSAAHENLANALVDQKKHEEAITEFRTAISLKPENADAYHGLGEALLSQGRTVEAIATLELAIRMRPDFYDAHFALGVALGSQGRLDAAVAAFRAAFRLKPELIDTREQVRIDRGREGALTAFREATRDFPRPVANRPGRVVNVVTSEKPELLTADRNGRVRPEAHAVGNIERGFAWISKKQYDKAIAEFNDAIRLEPGISDAYVHRGFAWSSIREYGKAIADYNRAIELDPQSAAAHNDRAWLLSTCPVPGYRDADKALESAIWACALSEWKQAHAIGTLAAAYAEASDFASAVKCQSKAIRLAPELERQDFRARLELYQRQKAYRQGPSE
jgi:tetratricopeptide (TPR) repeat protein